MYACTYVCTYVTYMCTYVHMHVREVCYLFMYGIYVCSFMRACMYVCMRARMYVCHVKNACIAYVCVCM